MNYLSPEILILALGILGAIAGLHKIPDVKTSSRWVVTLFFVGLVTQGTAQVLQYLNAVHYRLSAEHAAERQVAFALHALAERDVDLLRSVAPDHPYVVGYALFQQKKFDGAVAHFNRSIEKRSFMAPSHYMLGYLILRDPEGDWRDARKHFNAAIDIDGEYAAAYYARAIAEVTGHEYSSALEDLRKAVTHGIGQCRDLNDPDEIKSVWKPVANVAGFKKIQRECLSLYEVPKPRSDSMFIPQALYGP